MQYRLYDTKEKRWVKDEFYISYRGDIFLSKKGLFGYEKLEMVPESRYVYHRDTGVDDANGNLIFEGDIIKNTEDDSQSGVVAYSPNYAAFIVFDDTHSLRYSIDNNNRHTMEVIGNVFDGRKDKEDATD